MPDALTTITKLITSPPVQLAAGGILAGIVWKSFERVENVLKDGTKLEIARWLRVKNLESGLLTSQALTLHQTAATMFDQIFGDGFRCVVISCAATITSVFLSLGVYLALGGNFRDEHIEGLGTYLVVKWDAKVIAALVFCAVLGNLVPDYLSLMVARFFIRIVARTRFSIVIIALVVADVLFTLACIVCVLLLATELWSSLTYGYITREAYVTEYGYPLFRSRGVVKLLALSILPVCFTSVWLWLYAVSAFVIRAALRFDIGFEWFSLHLDIERRPLQSIGLVAGVLVAVAYWVAAIIIRRWS